MLKVEQKIHDFTEEQLKKAYDEFTKFKGSGRIEQSLIRDLYDEYRREIGVAWGSWITIELMVIGEIARRYYTMDMQEEIEIDPDSGYVSLDRYKELEDKYHCLRLKVG